MQLKIDRQLIPDKQPDKLHFCIEAGGKRFDLIITWLEISYVVPTGSIRPHDPTAPKLRLADSETSFRHDRAANVVNYSLDDSRWGLRQKSVLEQKD
jgi:hypothetical protein